MTRLKLQFLASLNHEIRTPLSGIFGMTDLLLETDLTEDQREYVVATRECAEVLFELLNTALAYNRLISGSVRTESAEFQLAGMVHSLVAEYSARAAQRSLRFETHLASDLPETVRGCECHIRQVCSLLLANAIKFTSKGAIRLRIIMAHGILRFSVEDTGVGISIEQLPYILSEPNFGSEGHPGNTSGLGLGLPLARGLVELMGGQLTVESTLGQGSRFSFTIPLDHPAASLEAPLPEAAPQPASRVLLVEDDRISQRIISAILAKAGVPCDAVPDGMSALEQAAAAPYSLVLMDLHMPGLDGFETARRLRSEHTGTRLPVVALTANSDDETRTRCWKAGMAAFLAKPVQPSELLATVRRFVQSSG